MASFYISPTGSGSGDGSSWANAATISKINALIAQAGPGGTVYLRADQGAYSVTSPINIRAGGVDGAPVTITGVDGFGQVMDATIVGTRNLATGAAGNEVFRLLTGANDLTFEHMVFRNVGNGAFRIGADINDLTIQHIDAFNVQRFIENNISGTVTSASVDGLVVRDVEVHGYSKGVVRLQYNSHDILIEDVTGDSEKQSHDSFAIGVFLDGTVHDVVLRRVTMENNWNSQDSYWNGDGFATEGRVYRVLFEDTVSRGNTDAGYDIKSKETILDGALGDANKRNFRIWSNDAIIKDSMGLDPHRYGGTGSQTQVWLGDNAKATIVGSTFSDSDSATIVYDLSKGAALNIVDDTVMKDALAMLQRLGYGATLTNADSAPVSEPGPIPSTETAALAPTEPAPTTDTDASHTDTPSGTATSDPVDPAPEIAKSLVGSSGSDSLTGGTGGDTLGGAKGADYLLGGDGDDFIYGNSESDSCVGGAGADVIRGGQGSDTLMGGDGNDWLAGDRDWDAIWGGAGGDTFYAGSGCGIDRIMDFNHAEGDRIQLAAGTSYHVRQRGADTVIELGGGDEVILTNVLKTALPAGWIAVG